MFIVCVLCFDVCAVFAMGRARDGRVFSFHILNGLDGLDFDMGLD